jgi:uncharacterized protein (TIGR02231 family)
MKKLVLFMGMLSFGVFSHANDLEIKSTIDKVKVFLTGAQIERTASANLKIGRNRIVLKNISAKLDEKSIQVRYKDDIRLMSVSTELDFQIFEGNTGRVGALNDSLKLIEERLLELHDIKAAINSEKSVLDKNKVLRGDNVSLTAAEIEKGALFYRKRMESINKELTKIKMEKSELQKRKWIIQSKLDELNFKESSRSNQIILIVDTKSSKSIDFTIEYFVSGCGWEPNYNLHAKDLSGTITMEYKAKVFNDTGNDWDNVDMILSTGNPNLSATFPELSPWYLRYLEYVQTKTIVNQKKENKRYHIPENNMNWDMVVEDNERKVSQLNTQVNNLAGFYNDVPKNFELRKQYFRKEDKNRVQYRTIEVSHLSSEFEIEDDYSIPSDKKPYLVDIKEHELAGKFEYVAIPKMERDAFLLAQIPGWERLDLVPGPTRVYFDGTYVGESWIDTRNVEDTLGLSFGRDSKILTSRKLLSEFSDKKVVGNNRKDSYTYEITVKNTRDMSVSIDLHDQIPISQDSDIQVTILEVSGAVQEEHTGILSWKVNLAAKESKKYKISFTIKYPKNKKVQVRSYRKMSAPRFL